MLAIGVYSCRQWRGADQVDLRTNGERGIVLLVSMNEQSSDEAEHSFGGLEPSQF
jgi:hypothetical protein